jgi:DNA-binding winged helix-turn-helix (wHTH) protein/TolB-like protein/Flp pilus assembly protein TadD
MELSKGHLYEFGPFRLNPCERQLVRENKPVPLSPKGFELLVFLVSNHGRLLTKDQIFENVWADSFVEESNLTVCISALRRALGEKDSDLQYIETVTKAGYRFIAPVKELDDIARNNESQQMAVVGTAGVLAPVAAPMMAPSSEARFDEVGESRARVPGVSAVEVPPQRRWRAATASVAILLIVALAGWSFWTLRRRTDASSAHSQSLAILPFQNLTHDPNSDFLGFSLADAVINKLGYVSSLTVRPSSAIEKYRDQVIDIQKVGADLKVDTLLTGNIVREGNDLRITPQLVDVKANKILWKGTIDVKYDNLFTVEDKVAQQIVKGLALNLTPSEAKQLAGSAPSNALAYEYYLRGIDLYARNDFPMAIRMLEKSAELDPNYPLTWAQLGTSYTAQASFQFGGKELYSKAQAAYEKALALDPAQVETRNYMANLLTDTGRVEQAVPLLREALKTNANNADLHWELGYAYRFGGMLHESAEECERARGFDPGVKLTTSAPNAYLYLGQYDKFLSSLPDTNDSPFVLFYRGFGKFYEGHNDEAARYFDSAYELDPTLLHSVVGKALSNAIKHQNAAGLSILQAAEKKIHERDVGDPEAIYKLAQAYAVLGDKTSALRMFRHSIENGFFPYPYFVSDPLLVNVRHEPEFAELMSTARKRQEAFKQAYF